MAYRQQSPIHDAPEAIHDQPRATFGFVGSDDYEYYEPPPSTFERQRSPVPEYQRYDQSGSATSPRISARSPPPPSSDITRSPQLSDGGFTKSRPLSPSVQYSEIHSPDPQAVYNDEQDKEAVYTPPMHSKAPSYQAYPVPGVHHQNSGDRPQLWDDDVDHDTRQGKQKKPFYKRWLFIGLIIALIVLIAVGVALGVVFGTKKSKSSDGTGSTGSVSDDSGQDNPNVDINAAIGGYINEKYYSTSGAWNGSGIAIAGANTATDQSIYGFYQDYTGQLQYTLMNPQFHWSLVGPVNAGSYKALNGTPLSTVQHQLGNQLVWHLFYIDEDYIIRERIITNTSTNGPSPTWQDGPLSQLNLKAWNSSEVDSNQIGLQGCYWGNYYGDWSYDATQISAGIHLWYASDATTFQQYSWTNGSATWTRERQWNDLSGSGGVGCQTWDTGMTEYVWFVDTKNDLAMYWQDNNRTATATNGHPIGEWTAVDIGVGNVQKDSSLGYTNYMIWQSDDTTIRGASITWGAEETKITNGTGPNGQDTWTLQSQGEDIHAIRGTHLSITAITTAGGSAQLLAFFQEDGNDMQMFQREAFSPGAVWADAGEDPVIPSKS